MLTISPTQSDGMATVMGPEADRMIDAMLTDGMKRHGGDPLDPGEFPSLGFPKEKRGNYYMQVYHGDLILSVWRMTQPNGAPPKYRITTYRRKVYNGVESYGANSTEAIEADGLLQVQAIIHNIITLEGNQGNKPAANALPEGSLESEGN